MLEKFCENNQILLIQLKSNFKNFLGINFLNLLAYCEKLDELVIYIEMLKKSHLQIFFHPDSKIHESHYNFFEIISNLQDKSKV